MFMTYNSFSPIQDIHKQFHPGGVLSEVHHVSLRQQASE